MTWTERDLTTGEQMEVTAEKAAKLNAGKDKDLPRVQKEDLKSFKQVKFQPVRSPNIYDAEFGVKDRDIVFHFWPYNYHEADRKGVASPAFPRDFGPNLIKTMDDIFRGRTEIHNDPDMGAFTVKALGWGENQFAFDLAVKACKQLHFAMGGTE